MPPEEPKKEKIEGENPEGEGEGDGGGALDLEAEQNEDPVLKAENPEGEKKSNPIESILPLLDVDKFTEDMAALKPSIFLAFPTIFTLLYQKIQ